MCSYPETTVYNVTLESLASVLIYVAYARSFQPLSETAAIFARALSYKFVFVMLFGRLSQGTCFEGAMFLYARPLFICAKFPIPLNCLFLYTHPSLSLFPKRFIFTFLHAAKMVQ